MRPIGLRQGLIRLVADRPGHDLRYAIDSSHITRELGWRPKVSFEEGLARTVDWYLANRDWWQPLVERHQALQRAGLAPRNELPSNIDKVDISSTS